MSGTDAVQYAPPGTGESRSTRSLYISIIGLMLGMFLAMLDKPCGKEVAE